MKIKFFLNSMKYFSVLALVLFALSNSADAKIENNVSATANTGGNTISGSGTIMTGDAKATVNAQNYVNGGENVENKVEVKAEGSKASVTVNGEEKSCTADAGESCEVEINNTDSNSEAVNNADAEASVDAVATTKPENTEPEKNIVQNITSAISDFTKSVIKKVESLFS
jgi:hypothetical protein